MLSWCRLPGTQMLMFPAPRGCQAVEHRGVLGDCHVAPPGELGGPQGGGLLEETQLCASQGTLSDTSIRSCPVPRCSPRIPCSQRQPSSGSLESASLTGPPRVCLLGMLWLRVTHYSASGCPSAQGLDAEEVPTWFPRVSKCILIRGSLARGSRVRFHRHAGAWKTHHLRPEKPECR